MRVVAYVPDLMDRSRVAAAVPGVRFVTAPADLAAAGADVVLVDLSRPDVLPALASVAARTVGFAPHVEHDLMSAAEAAGCAEVLPRSSFFRRLGELVADDR